MTQHKSLKIAAATLSGGLLLAPLVAGAANDTQTTTINAAVTSVISMTTSGTVSLSVTPVSGGSQSTQTDTVTVNSNNATGFDLTLSDGDAAATLVNGGNTIAAHAGTQGTPTTLANNKWGYRVSGIGGFTTTNPTPGNNITDTTLYAGVPVLASPNNIKSTSAVASNDTTTVYYSVKADTTNPNGTYTDTVQYVATTK